MTLADLLVMLNTVMALMEGQHVFDLDRQGNAGSAQLVIFRKLLIRAKTCKVGLAF